jgi:hypothetical protein
VGICSPHLFIPHRIPHFVIGPWPGLYSHLADLHDIDNVIMDCDCVDLRYNSGLLSTKTLIHDTVPSGPQLGVKMAAGVVKCHFCMWVECEIQPPVISSNQEPCSFICNFGKTVIRFSDLSS